MTNAEKIRKLDDEHLEKFLIDVQKSVASAVLKTVSDAVVAYIFDKDGKYAMKSFLKKEDNK